MEKRISINFITSNASFDAENKDYQVEVILKKIIAQYQGEYLGANIIDLNGNLIGQWEILDNGNEISPVPRG